MLRIHWRADDDADRSPEERDARDEEGGASLGQHVSSMQPTPGSGRAMAPWPERTSRPRRSLPKEPLVPTPFGDVAHLLRRAGFGGTTEGWEKVQPEVARFARVVSYDRAGMGKSEPGRKPRTAPEGTCCGPRTADLTSPECQPEARQPERQPAE